jgi:hypothetical protein
MVEQPAAGGTHNPRNAWPGLVIFLAGFLALLFGLFALLRGWRFAVFMSGHEFMFLALFRAIHEAVRPPTKYAGLVPLAALGMAALAFGGVLGMAAVAGWALP